MQQILYDDDDDDDAIMLLVLAYQVKSANCVQIPS